MGTSVRKMYDAELLQLDTMLARMGHAAGGAIESAMTALRTGDTELARSVIARDSEIDSAEHEIEHRCLTLFLRQQPVAGDLRKVSTALKMVTDIERIADQASDIAEITLHLHPEGRAPSACWMICTPWAISPCGWSRIPLPLTCRWTCPPQPRSLPATTSVTRCSAAFPRKLPPTSPPTPTTQHGAGPVHDRQIPRAPG